MILKKICFLFGFISLAPFAADSTTELLKDLPSKDDGFLWGVANAAFQVEGSPVDSDWLRFTHTPGKIADGTTADVACDFWHRYNEDFTLAHTLGANAFRISLAWERIEPQRGVFDEKAIDAYEKMIVALRAQGMEPVVTLQHFTLPGWLADTGGLLSPEFVDEYALYAHKVVMRLAKAPAKVSYWMTFNEPMVMIDAGYLSGEWPPMIKGDLNASLMAEANVARAHIEAVRQIRADQSDDMNVLVSVAQHWRIFQAHENDTQAWVAAKMTDWAFNRQLIDSLVTGKLMFWMPGGTAVKETIALPEGRSTLDYLGTNYYGRSIITKSNKPPYVELSEGPGPKSEIGWEMYPEGMYIVLKDAARYKLPILVSENGVADSTDSVRGDFIRQHLAQLNRARKEGVNVIGYLHWSLTDNFEWARGSAARFGLVDIDYKTQKRTPRPSFDVYKSLIH